MTPIPAPDVHGPGELVDPALAARLRLVVGRLARRIRLATPDDLPPLQFSALVTVEKCGPLRLGELAQKEAVSAPTMTKVLAALADRGLVERTPDPSDARSVQVSVSVAGNEQLNRIRSERTAMLDNRLAGLTDEQRELLRSAIPALEALVDQYSASPPKPS